MGSAKGVSNENHVWRSRRDSTSCSTSHLCRPPKPAGPQEQSHADQKHSSSELKSLKLIAEETKDREKEARLAELEAHLRFPRLSLCKDLLWAAQITPDLGAQSKAIKRLQSLIKDDPYSREAKEAEKLLEGLKKKESAQL
jgi:hypothetical protein